MDWKTFDYQHSYNGEIVIKEQEIIRTYVEKLIERYSCPVVIEECRFIGSFDTICFDRWNFYRCSFNQASLTNTTFSYCQSQETSWKLSTLEFSEIVHSEFDNDDFTGCNLKSANVKASIFHSCNFSSTNFELSKHKYCDFTCSKFKTSSMSNAEFQNCDLRGTGVKTFEETNAIALSESKKSPNKFNLIFASLVCFSLLSLILSLCISFQGELSPHQASLFETCSTTWKMGFGCIVGGIWWKNS